ncbi:AEC family transporter [Cohaesibacter celericrescens]|uniref:AEC family transporter n=1 Tax=Cohaesibacter celericrescens TaxID=2067669 RepID=A0A2N5XS13_9HYPH|nr:AEC family transporter [Cohaesibacter celericrescens]PLW77316.1 AEC family transporter [Cohaesibacter celericrescens]
MSPIVEAIIPTFFLVGLGLYLRRSELVPENQWAGLDTISYWLFFPALIFNSLFQADLTNVPIDDMAFVLVATIIVMAVLLLSLYPVFRSFFSVDNPSYTSIYQGVLRWNGFMALAIVQKAYGNDAMALVAVAMASLIPIINIIIIAIMAIFATEKRPSFSTVLGNILKNPFIIASLAGLAFNLLNIPLWGPIVSTIDVTGRAGLACALLSVGAGLRLRHAFPPVKEVWFACGLRLIGMPAIALFFSVLFGLKGHALDVVIISTAVPTAMNSYVLAKKMGGNAPLIAAIVALQTPLSALAIPLWLALVQSMNLG